MTAASVAPASAISSMTLPHPRPWSALPPKLVSNILTHLCPADIASFRVVCRAWHSAARQHSRRYRDDVHRRQLPWIVLPNGSFGTMSGDFFRRVPGLPDDVTCLGATGSWLVLDRTDDVFRRTNLWDGYDSTTSKFLEPRSDVRHKHSYMLYEPFSGRIVPLPELDSIVGDVPETFEIRKVLARSANNRPGDDLIAVTTNSEDHTVVICRPGKGSFVLPYLGVCEVVFFGDALYGITQDEDLVVFDLAENKDGEPIVSEFKRVISHPLVDGEEDLWSWMDDYQSMDEDDVATTADDDEETTTDDDEEATRDDDDYGDMMWVEDGSVTVHDEEVPYEPKDYIVTTRRLVESSHSQELLMVRHQVQVPPFDPTYTCKLDIFKADTNAGQWVPITATALAQGEALFLSRSTSRVTQAYGDIIKEGSVYVADMNGAFDTRSGTCSPVALPQERKRTNGELLTWLFPPQLML